MSRQTQLEGRDIATSGLLATCLADWTANPRDYKSRTILVAFRLAQHAYRMPGIGRVLIGLPLVAIYRFWTEWIIGVELRPKTVVGPGLRLYHSYALVVNDHASIGKNVTLRQCVTIGNTRAGGKCPIIQDGVEIGAGAIVLGAVVIGEGALVGAGAVVTKSVPAHSTVVGNPATVLRRS